MERNRFVMSIFVLCALAFFLSINVVVYVAARIMFWFSTPFQMWIVGIVLAILSLSFVCALILGNKYYNKFTRIYYLISVVWFGSLMYLCMASALYLIVVIFSGQIVSGIGIVLVLIAVATSAYGVVHERKIKIKELKIDLSRFPSVWKGKKAVFISDLHLGQVYGPAFAQKVTDMISGLSPDIVFIGGDLFDGTQSPNLSELIKPLSGLSSRLSSRAPSFLGTFFIMGNHEEFGKKDKFISAIQQAGIRTLIDEKVVIEGMQIIGIDYSTASKKENFEQILSNLSLDRTKPSIMLKHEPKDLDIAEKAGVSLSLSGHTHRGQQWPFGYLARSYYKGFDYGLKKCGEMKVITSSGLGTWGPVLRVGSDSEIVVITFN